MKSKPHNLNLIKKGLETNLNTNTNTNLDQAIYRMYFDLQLSLYKVISYINCRQLEKITFRLIV